MASLHPAAISPWRTNIITIAETDLRIAGRFESEDRIARELVRDLHTPSPRHYWTDLIVSSAIGWSALGVAVWARPFSPAMLAAFAVAVCALYRGLCFLHELSHIRRKILPGFEAAWNILIGFPLLMPSYMYLGVHQDHHSLSTYGTEHDPEYLPFGQNHRMTVVFAAESVLIPLFLSIRSLVLAPLGLLVPPFHLWLVRHASALTMNLRYRREAEPGLIQKVRLDSLWLLLEWSIPVCLASLGILPWRLFAIGFAVSSTASLVNTLRTLGAHRYDSHGDPLSRSGQLLDSIDVPGAWWTELWAPVGLRHHALHHYFPGVPYHNLTEVYRRLAKALPGDAVYREVVSPSLWRSLRALYDRGSAFQDRERRA